MKAVVIYESMYGNTHAIANSIADALRRHGEALAVPCHQADATLLRGADLLVVGGPTHAHGMSHVGTRHGAIIAASDKSDSTLNLDDAAEGTGLREWFASLGQVTVNAAAFDTRVNLPAAFTGRASKTIARKLRHHGATLISEPQSFFVTKANQLESAEQVRAYNWGDRLGFDLDGTGYFFPRTVAAVSTPSE